MFLLRLKSGLTGLFFNLTKKKRHMTLQYSQELPSTESHLQLDGQHAILVSHPDDVALFLKVTEGAHVVTATDGELGTSPKTRLKEDAEAHQYLGITDSHYLHLPDGELHKAKNIRRLARNLANLAQEHDYQAFFTMGQQGVDKHSDHKAVNAAAVLTAWRLRRMGKHVQVWGLDTSRHGDLSFDLDDADRKSKYEALLIYRSQFPNKEAIDTLVANEPPYASLMKREAYRRSDSRLDIGRAMLRSAIGYPKHIPRR